MAKKPIESLDKQWERWQAKNPPTKNINVDLLKQTLIDDLTKASQMDVKEYTLFQKWTEVKERYPGKATHNLFGEPDVDWGDDKQAAIINKVKNNIWVPKNADDYEKLEPQMYLANSKRVDEWNAIRTFSSTMKNNSNIGRNL